MKTLLSLFAVSAVLITGCGAAQASTPEPLSTANVGTSDHLKPTGAAVPSEPTYTIPQRPFPAVKADLSKPPADHAWEPDVPVVCDPSDCDPDEGETISPEELAELNAPLEDEPGWDCTIHGNKSCDPVVQPAATEPKAEDDPGWNCYADGNRVCGPQAEGLEAEAWERFTPAVLPAEIRAQGFKAEYMGTMAAGEPFLTDSWHTYHPSSKAGYNHVFKVEF